MNTLNKPFYIIKMSFDTRNIIFLLPQFGSHNTKESNGLSTNKAIRVLSTHDRMWICNVDKHEWKYEEVFKYAKKRVLISNIVESNNNSELKTETSNLDRLQTQKIILL